MATEREELIAKAEEMGLEFKRNESTVNLQLMVDKALREAEEKAIAAEAMKAEIANPAISAKIAEAKKNSDELRESMQVVKVKITPLDPRMVSLPSDMKTHISKYGTKKQAVPFGKPFLVFKHIADLYREQKTLQQVNAGLGSKQEDVVYQMSPAFLVEDLPLTQEELEMIKNK